jgi:hypothetical protein
MRYKIRVELDRLASLDGKHSLEYLVPEEFLSLADAVARAKQFNRRAWILDTNGRSMVMWDGKRWDTCS